jgi:dolichyl-diphosphooligosaccharide--protein glycosyltransferase
LFVCILVVYGLSFYKRQASYEYWMETPQEHVVDNVTVMSTMDAYYWLRMARELDAGNLGKGKVDPTKGYPELAPLAIKDEPSLLAVFISLGKNFTGGDYYRSGLLLIPILAGLFVFPLFFYFHRLGFGASAILGGLIGSFSKAYYIRTMMGRVDTDLLNTFFPLAAACFILPMDRDKSWGANCVLSAAAGLTMYLFTWWYQQPIFILVYLLVMAVHLLIGRVPWKQIGAILVLFLLTSGPAHVMQIVESARIFLRAYVSPPPTGRIAWPNILNIVTEAESRGLEANLQMLHGFLPLVFAGFAGLIYLYVLRFRQMIPITPLVLLGVWSLVGPNRFNMYLVPLIGVGAGVLVELLVRYAGGKFRVRPLPITLVSISLMFTLFFSTAAHTGFPYNAGTIVGTSTISALLDIKKIVPRHSAMITPWWE